MTDSATAENEESTTSDEDVETEPSISIDSNQPAPFDYITENVYTTERALSRDRKHSKKMVCVCQFDPEVDNSEDACGDTCLNHLLMIECGSRCPSGEYCNNRRFQKAQYAKVEVFKTEKKGWGLRAKEKIRGNTFVMEYCGEVLTAEEFEERKRDYGKQKRKHYYFMSLKNNEILDATQKGNLSRFINHSCDPNCETQKWTVNGRLRVGFFSLRDIEYLEEITFDYQFQRFGEKAQKCYCGSTKCRNYLGGTKQVPFRIPKDGMLSGGREGRRRGRLSNVQSPEDAEFEKEIFDIVGSSWKLKDSDQVLAFSRTMLQAETPSQRIMLLQVLQATDDVGCLKTFLSMHGLRLLWSWMVDLTDTGSSEMVQFKLKVLETLGHLPLTTKNQLDETKLLLVISKWKDKSSPCQSADVIDMAESKPEGTVVREADSGPSEEVPVIRVGGDVKEGKEEEEEEASREAEPREAISEGQESLVNLEDALATRAASLLSKWSALKEVYRIPKKAPRKLKSDSPEEPEKSDSEANVVEDDSHGTDRKTYTLKPHLAPMRSSRHRSHPYVTKIPEPPNSLQQPSSTVSQYVSMLGNVSNPSAIGARTFHLTGASTVPSGILLQQTGLQETRLPMQATLMPALYNQPSCGVPTLQTTMMQPNVVQFPATWPQSLLPTPMAFPPGITCSTPTPQPIQSQHQHFITQPVLFSSSSNTSVAIGLGCVPLPSSTESSGLPPNWKDAKDPNGKVYYYHIVTRKSQWERPVENDSQHAGAINGLLVGTNVPTSEPGICAVTEDDSIRHRGPRTPEDTRNDSPSSDLPKEPCLAYVPPSAETQEGNGMANGALGGAKADDDSSDMIPSPPVHSPAVSESHSFRSSCSTVSPKSKQKKLSSRDAYKHKLSKIVIHCLDQHRKPDCKYGRITCSEDFKYLARRLTYGLTEKEKGRKKELVFTDSVKAKVKEYIRQYMKKLGPVYKRT